MISDFEIAQRKKRERYSVIVTLRHYLGDVSAYNSLFRLFFFFFFVRNFWSTLQFLHNYLLFIHSNFLFLRFNGSLCCKSFWDTVFFTFKIVQFRSSWFRYYQYIRDVCKNTLFRVVYSDYFLLSKDWKDFLDTVQDALR